MELLFKTHIWFFLVNPLMTSCDLIIDPETLICIKEPEMCYHQRKQTESAYLKQHSTFLVTLSLPCLLKSSILPPPDVLLSTVITLIVHLYNIKITNTET